MLTSYGQNPIYSPTFGMGRIVVDPRIADVL
jgi:hypothetical protein